MSEFERLELLVSESIKATNRTTYAVRAFVGFLFIQLAFTTVALILWNIAQSSFNPIRCALAGESCSRLGWLEAIAGLVFLAGVLVSSNFGWREFGKSEVPEVQRINRVSGHVSNSKSRSSTPLQKCAECGYKVDQSTGKCSYVPSHRTHKTWAE